MNIINKNEDKKNECPIPETHTRLNQAFSLFENILEDYQNELRFTAALNNLIQNLRNVTFVLQKELAHENGFEDWYSKEKDRMKEDKALKWMNDARVHIVHEGDLRKKSYARVSLKNHYNHKIIEEELDPIISTEKIAQDFCKKIKLKIQENLLEETIIEVERIWIVEEYPDVEVIDVLIYCFGSLTDLVYRVHEEFFKMNNALLCEKNIYVESFEDFMSVLHNKILKSRITRINYKTGGIYEEYTRKIFHPNAEMLKRIKERYGNPEYFFSLIDNSGINIPFNNIEYHIEMAKHLFNIDGYLQPIAFLYFSDKEPILMGLGLYDPATRYLVFEKLAEKIEETRCCAFVVVGESWRGDMPREGEEYIPARIQKKSEYISILGVNSKEKQEYHIEIIRDENGNPTIEKEVRVENSKHAWLDRIYRIWRSYDNDVESKP